MKFLLISRVYYCTREIYSTKNLIEFYMVLVNKLNKKVNMCSSPKPKASVKGKRSKSTSGLASLSPEARSRFTQRANEAQERRYQIKKEEQQRSNVIPTVKVNNKQVSKNKTQHTLSYWLLNANLKEITFRIFGGKTKTI